MRNKVSQIICGGVIFSMLFGGSFLVGYAETHYTRNAVVLESNGSQVFAVDLTGNVWGFENEGFKDGEEVILSMHTNGTDNILEDDIVINAKLKR